MDFQEIGIFSIFFKKNFKIVRTSDPEASDEISQLLAFPKILIFNKWQN